MESSDDDFNFDDVPNDMAVGPAAQRALADLSDSDREDEPRVPAPVVQGRRQRRQSDENYYGEFDDNGYRITRRDLIGGTLNEGRRMPTQRSYSPNREGTKENLQKSIKKHTESTIEAVDSTLSESTNYYKTQIKYKLSENGGIEGLEDVPQMLAEYQVELKYEILDNFEKDLFADEHGIKQALADANMFDTEDGTIHTFKLGRYEKDDFPASKTEKFRKLKRGSTEKALKELKETVWPLPNDKIKEYINSAKMITGELLRADHIANIYERSASREWDSIDEELDRREDIFNAEMDSSLSPAMIKFTDKMKQYKNEVPFFKKFIDGGDDDLLIEDEELIGKCAISKRPIRQAARTTCKHIFDYNSLIQFYEQKFGKKQDKKECGCPQPGCQTIFKKADIKKDLAYQRKLDQARRDGEISD